MSVVAALLSLGVFLTGCTPGDVILDVDGRLLTAKERDDEIDLRMKIIRKADRNLSDDAAAKRCKMLLDSVERHFIDETVLLCVARERGLSATADEVKRHMDGVSHLLAGFSAKERALAKDIAKREVLCEKSREALISEIPSKVTAVELDQALSRIKRYADMVAATNAVIYARATNIWREVSGGKDFAEAARQYSEDEDKSSCEWGQFPLEAFAEEPMLRRVVGRMRIGGVSPPVEGDNGLMIVRLKGIDTEALPQRYDLERIFFRLPEDAPQMTVGEVASLISEKKRRDGLEARLADLRQKARVVHH